MDACICAYITTEETATENESTTATENQQNIKNETDISILFNQEIDLEQELQVEDDLSYQQDDKQIDCDESNSTFASQILALVARNWQLKRDLNEAEESIKCLEQTLRDYWSKSNAICYDIQKLKEQKTKLNADMQKLFATHVIERNKSVLEIATARQNNMLIIQEINLADAKNRQLKIDRNATAEFLYMANVELYQNRTLAEISDEQRSNSSDLSSENGNLTISATSMSASGESFSETNSTICTTIDTESVGSSTEYMPEDTSVDISEVESQRSKHKNEEVNLICLEEKKPANEIRLDLSFIEKEVLHNVDSGFSEATANLASQSTKTTIRIIDATTPNILE